jgi:hypothetical protein
MLVNIYKRIGREQLKLKRPPDANPREFLSHVLDGPTYHRATGHQVAQLIVTCLLCKEVACIRFYLLCDEHVIVFVMLVELVSQWQIAFEIPCVV